MKLRRSNVEKAVDRGVVRVASFAWVAWPALDHCFEVGASEGKVDYVREVVTMRVLGENPWCI